MSLIVFAWDEDTAGFVEYPDRLRVDTLEVTIMAAECQAGSGEVALEDPTGDFYVAGLRPLFFRETEAQDDGYFGIIGPFWTEKRWEGRGDNRIGSQRRVRIALRDLNSLLSLRVQKGTDAERTAETDVARMQWLVATAEVIGGFGDDGFTIEETTRLFTDGPVNMSESDYTGIYAEGVVNDCMQQSGANAYLYNAPTHASEPIRVGIWYGRTERSDFASIHKISNVLSDISPEVLANFEGYTPGHSTPYVFPPSFDTELERDPSRQITGVMIQYDGDYVYASNPIITPTPTRRDMVFEGGLVKTDTAALARAQRYLDDLEEEDDAIPCTVLVPAKLIHAFLPGHRVQYKNSYMTGYSDYVWMRIAKVTYRQSGGPDDTGGFYQLAMDLRSETPPGPAAPEPPDPFVCTGGAYDTTVSGSYSRNGSITTTSGAMHYYWKAGHAVPIVPTAGYVGSWSFPVFDGTADHNVSNLNFWRIIVVGPGSLTIHTTATSRGSGATTATSYRAVVKHYDGAVDVTDATYSGGVPGTDLTISIPEDAAQNCIHYIDIDCPSHSGPGGMGANGATWVSG